MKNLSAFLLLGLGMTSVPASDFRGTFRGQNVAIATETTFSMIQAFGPLKLYHTHTPLPGGQDYSALIEAINARKRALQEQIDQILGEAESEYDAFAPFLDDAEAYRDLRFPNEDARRTLCLHGSDPDTGICFGSFESEAMTCPFFEGLRRNVGSPYRKALRLRFGASSVEPLLKRLQRSCDRVRSRTDEAIAKLRTEQRERDGDLTRTHESFRNLYRFSRGEDKTRRPTWNGQNYVYPKSYFYFDRTSWFDELGTTQVEADFRSLNLSGDKVVVEMKFTNPGFAELNFEGSPTVTVAMEAQLTSCNNQPLAVGSSESQSLREAVESLRRPSFGDFFACDLSLSLRGFEPASREAGSLERYAANVDELKLELTRKGDLILKDERSTKANSEDLNHQLALAEFGFLDLNLGRLVPVRAIQTILDESFFRRVTEGDNLHDRRLARTYQWFLRSTQSPDDSDAMEIVREQLEIFNRGIEDYGFVLLKLANENLAGVDHRRVNQAAIDKYRGQLATALTELDRSFPSLSVLNKIAVQRSIHDLYHDLRRVSGFATTMAQFEGFRLIDTTTLKF